MLRDIVNNQLLPRMAALGFPVSGLRFAWNDVIDYTPEQQVAFETMVADRYDVDPEYFAEKYGMPVGARRDIQPALPTTDDKDVKIAKVVNVLKVPNDPNDPKAPKVSTVSPRPFFD